MAAISALMYNDNTLRKDNQDEQRSPTTPQVTPRSLPSASLSESTGPSSVEPPRQDGAIASESNPAAGHNKRNAAGAGMLTGNSSTAQEDDDLNAMDIDQMKDESDDGLEDDDGEHGDGNSTSRKKRGQRFFCTGYPPCNLSFTRSEHLARHIRKHTGERPFQCHCNRRFSRLDNLRQHAQTVHVNEDIPTDSLAATGTRFQRQIRTDRVRPAGRPRTNTMSSAGSHSRGHSRNLSTSSIGSIASTTSNYSTSDARRRPPPLLMTTDTAGRPKLGLDTPRTPPAQFVSYANNSPGDLTTPTSNGFSATPGSPSFATTTGSPISSTSRMAGFLGLGGSRAPARRLSVPTGNAPYQPQYAPMAYSGPYGVQSGSSSAYMSSNSSAIASPTASVFPYTPGFNIPPTEDWRRRTWHPSTYSHANPNYNRPATSGLLYSQTPDAPQPAFASNATAAAGQAPRLPGIESFDHVQQRPSTPPRRNANPNHSENVNPPPLISSADNDDYTRHQQYHSPNRAYSSNAYGENGRPLSSSSSWVQETIDQIHQVQNASSGRDGAPTHRIMGPPATISSQHIAQEALHLNDRAKRNAWYSGPGPAVRTSPEDSSSSEGVPTPGTSAADVQPAIVNGNSMIEVHHHMLPADAHANSCLVPPQHTSTHLQGPRPRADHSFDNRGTTNSNMNPLDALVAVATSEKNNTGVPH